MSAGISMLGRAITLTVGGATLAGYVSKTLDFNGSDIATTDAMSSGWRELDAEPGSRSIDLSVEGIVKNMELVETFVNSTSHMAECIVTFDDLNSTASTLTFNAKFGTINLGMPSDEGSTFSTTLQSSGVPVFTAGT